MADHTTDSQRAWTLLINRIERVEQALDRADEDDVLAWREYRAKTEAADKAFVALRADLTTLQIRSARNATRTPIAQKLAWTLGAGVVAMILARLGVDLPPLVNLVVRWLGGR